VNDMDRMEYLRSKASNLPLTPGVYIMKNKSGKIIYIGKSKALRNRVYQYFTDSQKNAKTAKMVSEVHEFDYLLTETEMEALVLENMHIKAHKPKYNILLKDAKSYPYIKVDTASEYPNLYFTRKRVNDKSKYYGPYSGSSTVNSIIKTLKKMYKLPVCNKSFPENIGKVKPCIYYQIDQCCGVCTGRVTSAEYRERFSEISMVLGGNYKALKEELVKKMKFASENLAYEAAALYRDRIRFLDALLEKQKLVTDPDASYDIFSLYTDEFCSCLSVYFVRLGVLSDSANFVFNESQITESADMLSFFCELYSMRDFVPDEILIGFEMEQEHKKMLADYLKTTKGIKPEVRTPQRGDLKSVCDMVYENAKEHAANYKQTLEKDNETLGRLAVLGALEVFPENIEAIDISNIGNEEITAGLISVVDGKFNKKGYRLYKIRSLEVQNDYVAMTEALSRRISHKEEHPLPDLFLVDGGKGHVNAVNELFQRNGIEVAVLGMVKDSFHKTRALTDGESEFSIAKDKALFMLIYKIQEEVHRFSINAMKRSKTGKLVHSSLTKIKGIGKEKAKALLSHFEKFEDIRNAGVEELAGCPKISRRDAEAVYNYFKKESNEKNGVEK